MKDYKIVTALGASAESTCNRLSTQVQDAMKEGWIPFGSMALMQIPSGCIAAQPMIEEFQ